MTDTSIKGQDVNAPGGIASGALYSNRINPCGAVIATGVPSAGETTVIPRAGEGGEITVGPLVYTRCNAIIFDAIRILECLGYLPVLVRKSKIPLDIVGIRGDGALIIEVVRSRRPLPDARTVCMFCRTEIDYLRDMNPPSQFRKMIWVYSPRCRWRFYDVFPGGIWLAHDLMERDRK